MSYTDEIRRVSYVGNGSTSVFTVPFTATSINDISVYINNQLQIQGGGADYTVQFNGDLIDTITTTNNVANNSIIVIQSNVQPSRLTEFTNNTVIRSSAFNTELNRVYSIIDELKERLDRKFGVSDGAILSASTVFPSPNSGFVIGWNANNQLVNVQAASAVSQLPNIGSGDAGKFVSVNLGETGYELATLGVDTNGNLTIENNTDPFIIIRESTNDVNSYFRLKNNDDTISQISHIGTGEAIIEIDPISLDQSAGNVRFFKNSNSGGPKSVSLYNVSGTVDSEIGISGVNTYFNTTGGNFGIGSSTPQSSLDISNRTDGILIPNGTTAQAITSANSGVIRYNSSKQYNEVYNPTTLSYHSMDSWTLINSVDFATTSLSVWETTGLDKFDEIRIVMLNVGPDSGTANISFNIQSNNSTWITTSSYSTFFATFNNSTTTTQFNNTQAVSIPLNLTSLPIVSNYNGELNIFNRPKFVSSGTLTAGFGKFYYLISGSWVHGSGGFRITGITNFISGLRLTLSSSTFRNDGNIYVYGKTLPKG